MPRRRATPATLAAALLATLAAAQEPPGKALSPRNANYVIEVSLDPVAKTLSGRQTTTWRNLQQTPTDELYFHLWWNAWRNDHSTFMREDVMRGRSDHGDDVREYDWGYLEVETATSNGVDLMPSRRYAAPDNGNEEDRTVMVLTLPQPVAPGESVTVELTWRARIPRTFARTGYRGDDYFIAHWFPQLGVYEAAGWNCHHFHAATEFFADYGVYDVTLELPDGLVVGATGRLASRDEVGSGRVRYRYLQEDVHGFAWTASPRYLVREDRFAVEGLPAVDLRLLIQPEHRAQASRYFHATKAALEHYGRWYGPYPYRQLTIVDPPYRLGAGGMEYPTLFTGGSAIINPFGGGSPEGVTVHEAGHQFWYGVVGNNEIEHAWLDEGLNTFSTARVMDVVYGRTKLRRSYLNPPGGRPGGFVRVLFDDVLESRAIHGSRFARFIASEGPTMDPMSVPTFLAYPAGAGSLSYHKTAMWLHTLENYLGWERLQPAMAAFYRRFAFRHPKPEDFFAVLEEVTGEDLGWFFDQVYYDSVQFDYAVAKVTSRPAAVTGYVEGEGGELVYRDGKKAGEAGEEATIYRNEVVVRRHGGGVFPVELLMVFEDGSEARRAWDGGERWRLFVDERPSKLAYAVIDPERVLLLDLDYTNNSRLRAPEAAFPARKWASKWMIWLQDLLTTVTFFL